MFDYLIVGAGIRGSALAEGLARGCGPWGLSRLTERRPMYLSPDLGLPTSLPPAVAESMALALRRIEQDDDVTSASQDLAATVPAAGAAGPRERTGPGPPGPGRAGPVRELRRVGDRDTVPDRGRDLE